MSEFPIMTMADVNHFVDYKQQIENSIYTVSEFLKRDLKINALLPGVIPAFGVTAVNARRGTGKSVFMEDLCMRIACEMPWNGIQPAEGWACVYLCGEDDNGLQRNIKAWDAHHGTSAVDGRLFIGTDVPNLMDAEDVKTWAELLKERVGDRPCAIFIDTWQRATSYASQNDDKEMQKAVHMAEALARFLNGCAIIAFHPPKGRSDTINGSMVIENSTSCILEITGEKGKRRKVEVARIKGPGEGKSFDFHIHEVPINMHDTSGNQLTGVVALYGDGSEIGPVQGEYEDKRRESILRPALAGFVRREIEEDGSKPLSITAIINRWQVKESALSGLPFPGKDQARRSLNELFSDPHTFEDGAALSLVPVNRQLKEFRLSPATAETIW